MPVLRPMPSRRAQSWMIGPLRVGLGAELVEEDVGGHRQRPAQLQRAEHGVLGVLELLRAELEHAGVDDRRARGDQALLQRRHRGHDLEGRAGRVGRGDRAVEQRRAAGLGVELVVLALRERLGEHVRVEARVGAEREDLAVARVHRHVGARLGAVARRGRDRAPQRVVGRALEVEVERELELVALLGLHARGLAPLVAVAERVDDDLRVAVPAAQVGVVLVLDAAGADPRARRRRRGSGAP